MRIFATLCCALLPLALAAEELPPSGSALGGAGLIETRNARFHADGALEAGSSIRHQRRAWFLNFQALPFLETSFRLTERFDSSAGHGMTTDRGFDLKLRLLEESEDTPALAIGLQDFIGTGLYSGEYIVASKRWHGWDFTAGLGWGRLGSAGDWTNPLALASGRMRDRPRHVGRGGRVNPGLFRGEDVAPFFGVEWSLPALPTPWGDVDGFRLKAEWSGDAFRDERGLYGGERRGAARSRLNAGLEWGNGWLEAGLYAVHGTDLLARVSLRLNAQHPPSLAPPPPPPLPPRPASTAAALARARAQAGEPEASAGLAPGAGAAGLGDATGLPPALGAGGGPDLLAESGAEDALLAPAIFAALEEAGFRPVAFRRQGALAEIAFAEGRFRGLPQAAARVLRAVQALLPPQTEMLRLRWWQLGAEIAVLDMPRQALEAAASRQASPEEAWLASHLRPATGQPGPGTPWAPIVWAPGPRWAWEAGPRLALRLGDPTRSLRWQAAAGASARVELGEGWAIAGGLQQRLLGNLDGGLPSDSRLPHVRSDYARYADQGGTALTALYLERVWNAAPDVFARGTAGWLEPMFAGLSSEVLWRPRDRGFALGLDLNWVQQRDYDQRLGVLGYSVVTGHASAYAELPWWNLYGVLRAGRYLAGDWGGTIELGRRFDSGIEIGGFATLTNVSAARFGEGSFDKGIYIRIPLALFGRDTRGTGGVLIRPVQRDGGQMLAVDSRLWEVTREGRQDALRRAVPGFAH